MTFCGIRAQFGDGSAQQKLRNQRPKFYVKSCPPQFKRDDFIGHCIEAFGGWSNVCDLIFAPTNDESSAQFVIFTHQFDGPSGILADCEFPGPVQQSIRIDPTEKWTPQFVVPVLRHEMGHGIGIPHFDPAVPPPELMNPFFNPAITTPQPGEISFVQKYYGVSPVTPPTPVIPIGDSLAVEMIITGRTGEKYQAKGTAKRIQ